MRIIPLYGNAGEVLKGFQLMLVPKYEGENSESKLIIKFPDHTFDNVAYKYESNLIRMDLKKIYVNETQDFERYYILSSAQIRSEFVYHHMFNIFELHSLLRQSVTTLMNMIPFKFSNLILDEINFDVNETDFFKNMEILFGKSLSDLFLKNPTKIKQALAQYDDCYSKQNQLTVLQKHVKDYPNNIIKRLIETEFYLPN